MLVKLCVITFASYPGICSPYCNHVTMLPSTWRVKYGLTYVNKIHLNTAGIFNEEAMLVV